MPIFELSGPDAVRTRKANGYATWGNRNVENRVEPIARPAFDVPFRLKKKEKIFTIGSCFARHVEGELLKRGFKIPVRDLFKTPAFEGLNKEIVNNFGTPSIYNEFAWAFGVEHFDEELGFFKIGEDKYIDLHMVNSIRPAPLEQVRARRQGLLQATREFAQCRVMIMTLGLVELWWDEKAGCYLNTTPMPAVLRAEPERFSLHVLSFDECRAYLEKAFAIIFENGRKGLHVVLTVSPVPMAATHRNCDVITANSYSKSVLRSVAEHVTAGFDNLSYFPSYETVMLSDRRVSWDDDLVHVRRDMVAFNVDRMVSAFSGDEGHDTIVPLPETGSEESGEAILLAEKARQARAAGDDQFFDEHADAANMSDAFALEYARYLFEKEEFEDALALIANQEDGASKMLRAELHHAIGNHEEAEQEAMAIVELGAKSGKHWHILLDSAVAFEDPDRVIAIEERWTRQSPADGLFISAYVARALMKMQANDEGIIRAEQVMQSDGSPPFFAQADYAELLIRLGRNDEARQAIDAAVPQRHSQKRRLVRLRKRLKSQQASKQ